MGLKAGLRVMREQRAEMLAERVVAGEGLRSGAGRAVQARALQAVQTNGGPVASARRAASASWRRAAPTRRSTVSRA